MADDEATAGRLTTALQSLITAAADLPSPPEVKLPAPAKKSRK